MSGLSTPITDESQLNADLITLASETSGSFLLNITSNFTLDIGIEAIDLQPGVTLTIDGNAATLNGNDKFRGFLVYVGNVTLENMALDSTAAIGGAGGAGGYGGGGGAGLGGGLFVAGGGNVTLNNVNIIDGYAKGGAGGAGGSAGAAGGGGGMAGAGGGAVGTDSSGGGGGLGGDATGGSKGGAGHVGIFAGSLGGGSGNTGYSGGTNAGGGGAGSTGAASYGGGGGIGGANGVTGSGGTGGIGGAGGFGGGGGGGFQSVSGAGGQGGAGGFGGGGGAGNLLVTGKAAGGAGGFGGGGGGGGVATVLASGGYGGGSGGGGGGGGLGAGGDVFVQQGGTLIVGVATLDGGTAVAGVGGGDGATNGSAAGGGIFLQGNESITLAPGAGQTLDVQNPIADQNGSSIGLGAGNLVIGAGTVELNAANTYTGGTSIEVGGTLMLGTPTSAGSGPIALPSSATTTLFIQPGTTTVTVPNTIDGLAAGDAFDLVGFEQSSTAPASVSFDGLNDQLTAIRRIGSIIHVDTVLQLETGRTYDVSAFHAALDPAGTGTLITYTACFAADARILTEAGERSIQSLATGDRIATRSGRLAPIVWIGRRRIEQPSSALRPVRIRAHAFGPDHPHADLLLSPDHAVWTGEALIPARYLINGVTIVGERAASVDYFHLELARHDVIYAAGLPAESYLDTGNRSAFFDGAKLEAGLPEKRC